MLYSIETSSGKNYLFIISIDDYEYQSKLNNAVADAMLFKSILLGKFQFEAQNVFELKDKDATKQNIFEQFKKLKSICTPADSLVVYYSGHGHFDADFDEGYWIPSEVNHPSDFISNKFFTDTVIPAIKTLHTIFIVDSCFSGTMFQNIRGGYEALQNKPSKWLLASGRNEVVPDGPKGEHSPFAKCLTDYLANCQEPIAFSKVIQVVKEAINHQIERYPQSLIPMPIGGRLQNSGDKGGEFVFHPKLKSKNPPQNVIPEISLIEEESFRGNKSRHKINLPKDKLVRGGTFLNRAETVLSSVKLSIDDFFLNEHPITNNQFAIFLNHCGNTIVNERPIYGETGNLAGIEKISGVYKSKLRQGKHPVNYVSWIGANMYIDWINEQTGFDYRLPTEAEWEFAASDGAFGFKKNGNPISDWVSIEYENLNGFAWNKTNSKGKLHPVMRKKAQPNLGLYDMSGNVWEWCLDIHDISQSIAPSNPNLKKGIAYLQRTAYENMQTMHVLKGGSYLDDPTYLKLGYRTCSQARDVFKSIGFRLARSL